MIDKDDGLVGEVGEEEKVEVEGEEIGTRGAVMVEEGEVDDKERTLSSSAYLCV